MGRTGAVASQMAAMAVTCSLVGGRRGWVSSPHCLAISVMLVCSMVLQMAAMDAVFSPMRGEPWQWWW